MADRLVHPILKRGHSYWLVASHNVLSRFRQKHMYLERLHYHVATNLGLLQANMTHEFEQQGSKYHWLVDLYEKLKLPILYEGVQSSLEKHNEKRKAALDFIKTEKAKKKRVELKSLRTKQAQDRKLWSKQHGQDTYGANEECVKDAGELKDKNTKRRAPAKSCKACGSTTHLKSNHKDCPYNKKLKAKTSADQPKKKTADEHEK